MELTTIALIGFVLGVFSNPIPIIGGLAFNILTTSLLLVYQQLAEAVSAIPMLPTAIFVASIAYSLGVFLVRFLAVLPIPFIQPIAQSLKGGN